MDDKESKNKKTNAILEDLEVDTHFPIKKQISSMFQKTQKKLSLFIKNQIPSSKNNLKYWFGSFRGKLILFCSILVILIPYLFNEGLWYHTFILAMIYSIYAASWDLLSGVTGQVSFGHAAFFGIGGYACGALVRFLQINIFISIIIGGVLAVLIGLIISVPSLRLKGPYLALATLAFSLFLWILFRMDTLEDYFWGTDGINLSIFNPILLMGLNYEFIIIVVIMFICIILLLVIYNSNIGTIFKAIRDDEISTEASGVNVLKFKLISFMISAFFAGIAGSLYVLHNNQADPFIFMPTKSFYPVIMTCIGGIATISGAVFGAYFFSIMTVFLEELLSMILPNEFLLMISNISIFIFAAIILIVVRFQERGLMEPTIENTRSLYDLLMGK
jgi:branched-chain amino acid transport system permease protein